MSIQTEAQNRAPTGTITSRWPKPRQRIPSISSRKFREGPSVVAQIAHVRGWVTTYPIFERLFPFLKRPWRIVHPDTRGQFWTILRDGFYGSRFNIFWHPPKTAGRRLKNHCGDYGHSYYYDELFSGGNAEVNSVCDGVGSPGTVLDIGGGSGRLAEKLVYGGSRVTLIDSSETMVNKAHERCRRLPSRLRGRLSVVHCDVGRFGVDAKFEEKFDTAISLNNGFEHLDSWECVRAALANVHRCLKPGGRLYVDVHNCDFWEATPYWGVWRWVDEGERRLPEGAERLFSRTRSIGNRLIWDHAVGRREFTLCRTSLLWASRNLWESALLGQDFLIESIWGNWDREAVGPLSKQLIFSCRKTISRGGIQSYSI